MLRCLNSLVKELDVLSEYVGKTGDSVGGVIGTGRLSSVMIGIG